MAGEKRVGILVVSDRASRGEYEDVSGPAVTAWALGVGLEVAFASVVPDERERIQEKLKEWADELHLDLILTSGGTGLGPRDVTPEATRAAIDREVPGIPERIRAAAPSQVPLAVLSRAVAGLRGRTLIVNLPGHPKAVQEGLSILEPLLSHAFAMVEGKGHEEKILRPSHGGASRA